MDLEERITRLERIAVQLRYLTLLNSDLFKSKDEKNSIAELSKLVEEISREHGLQVDTE